MTFTKWPKMLDYAIYLMTLDNLWSGIAAALNVSIRQTIVYISLITKIYLGLMKHSPRNSHVTI